MIKFHLIIHTSLISQGLSRNYQGLWEQPEPLGLATIQLASMTMVYLDKRLR